MTLHYIRKEIEAVLSWIRLKKLKSEQFSGGPPVVSAREQRGRAVDRSDYD